MNTEQILKNLGAAARTEEKLAEGCPPDEMFRAYRDGRLELEEVEGLERHLLSCDRCVDFLAMDVRPLPVLRDGIRRTVLAATEPSRQVASRLAWIRAPSWALGTALAAVLAVFLFWPRGQEHLALPPYSLSLTGQVAEVRGADPGEDRTGLPTFGADSELILRAAPVAVHPGQVPMLAVYLGRAGEPLRRISPAEAGPLEAEIGLLEVRVRAGEALGDDAGEYAIALLIHSADQAAPTQVEWGEKSPLEGTILLIERFVYTAE